MGQKIQCLGPTAPAFQGLIRGFIVVAAGTGTAKPERPAVCLAFSRPRGKRKEQEEEEGEWCQEEALLLPPVGGATAPLQIGRDSDRHGLKSGALSSIYRRRDAIERKGGFDQVELGARVVGDGGGKIRSVLLLLLL